MISQLSLSFLIWAAVSALPNPALPPAQVCKNVDAIVNVLHVYPQAASFCSSFIKIPIVTSTSTKTIGTITAYTATMTNILTQSTVIPSTLASQASSRTTVATATSTAFVTETTTVTTIQDVASTTNITAQATAAPITTTTTQTVTSTSTYFPAFIKRRAETDQLAKRALPTQLAKFASSALSTGCSCLNLPTSTTTTTISVTQTVNAVSTATAITVASSVVTVTSITTQVILATAQTVLTNTVTSSTLYTSASTSLVVSSITSTVTPTSTSTTTTTVLATVTATTDPCSPSTAVHYTNGDGEPFHDFEGRNNPTVEFTSASALASPEGCCRACYAGTNCDYVFFLASQFGNSCYAVGLGTGYTGASATCPNGISFGSATGGSPGLMDDQGQNFVVGPCYAGPR